MISKMMRQILLEVKSEFFARAGGGVEEGGDVSY